ncbi:MAG: hypothetical protein Q9218_003544 [Villophora microphyllina]
MEVRSESSENDGETPFQHFMDTSPFKSVSKLATPTFYCVPCHIIHPQPESRPCPGEMIERDDGHVADDADMIVKTWRQTHGEKLPPFVFKRERNGPSMMLAKLVSQDTAKTNAPIELVATDFDRDYIYWKLTTAERTAIVKRFKGGSNGFHLRMWSGKLNDFEPRAVTYPLTAETESQILKEYMLSKGRVHNLTHPCEPPTKNTVTTRKRAKRIQAGSPVSSTSAAISELKELSELLHKGHYVGRPRSSLRRAALSSRQDKEQKQIVPTSSPGALLRSHAEVDSEGDMRPSKDKMPRLGASLPVDETSADTRIRTPAFIEQDEGTISALPDRCEKEAVQSQADINSTHLKDKKEQRMIMKIQAQQAVLATVDAEIELQREKRKINQDILNDIHIEEGEGSEMESS